MAGTVEYFWDVSSPYTYLAHTQLPALAERTGATIVYRPFLLGGAFKLAGNSMPAGVPNKGKFLFADIQRWADQYGVTIAMPSFFPVNSLKAMRGAFVADREGKQVAYADAVFRAIWADGVDVSRPELLAKVAEGVGIAGETLLAGIEEPGIKEALKAATSEAVERGAFGAPTFFVGGDLFWGNDRLHHVEAALAA